ncbi:hypothetical protein LguiA_027450 [Lonicera macranthoides]
MTEANLNISATTLLTSTLHYVLLMIISIIQPPLQNASSVRTRRPGQCGYFVMSFQPTKHIKPANVLHIGCSPGGLMTGAMEPAMDANITGERYIMPTKRSCLASDDQSCVGMSKRVSTAHITRPKIARQELAHSLDDLEENAGFTNSTSFSNIRGRSSAEQWKEWNNGEKKIIGWNSMCQPIEPNCDKLATQLGYFARQGSFFPLSMTCWTEASKDTLDLIWKSVKENTNAPEGFKPLCFEKIGKSWRSFKNRVKERYYKTIEADLECRARVPFQMKPD